MPCTLCALGSSGLTPGSHSFTSGTALPGAIPFAVDIACDGNASPEVMSALALLLAGVSARRRQA